MQQQESMKNKSSCSCLYSNVVHSFPSVTYQCLFFTLILIASINGSLESNIMCRFSEQNQTVFWTGEFVSGNIECIKSDHQELKLKSIDVELIGLLVYKCGMRGTRNGAVRKFPSSKIFFNQRLNLRSANAQGNFLLPYGNDKWPFRFFLNDSLPPSLKPNKPTDSYIHYFLQIVFFRPEWYKKNIKKSIPSLLNIHRRL